MSPPIFLTVEDIIESHEDLVATYGGSSGLRDRGRLESAVAMPQTSFGGEFVHSDLAEMAAAYLFHIAKNHPFVDGSKRTAAMTAFNFLDMNGLTLKATGREYEKVILGIAEGKLAKSQAAEFFRKHAREARAPARRLVRRHPRR